MKLDATTQRLFTHLSNTIDRRNVDGMLSLGDYRRMVELGKAISRRTGLTLEDVLTAAGLN